VIFKFSLYKAYRLSTFKGINMFKYIIVKSSEGTYPFLFSKSITHSFFYSTVKKAIPGSNPSVVGAGFAQISANGNIYCYGESISLNVKSNKEDSDIFNNQ
jgi:hypothetical protein